MFTLLLHLPPGSRAIRWTELAWHGTPSGDFCLVTELMATERGQLEELGPSLGWF